MRRNRHAQDGADKDEGDGDDGTRLPFVAGGGANEIALARRLKQLSLELEFPLNQDPHRMALIDLAACCEELVEALADNAGLDAQRIGSLIAGGCHDLHC